MIVLEQVIIILVLIAIGFLSMKLKIMTIDWHEGVGKFTIYIALPALIFRTIASLGGRQVLLASIPALILSFILIFTNFGLGKFIAKISGLKGATADTHLSATAMGNLGYIGIPMVSALYANNGLLVLSVYMIIDVMLNWTVGINFMDQNKNQSSKQVLKSLITPLNITLIISVLFLALDINPSVPVKETIAGSSVPLSLINRFAGLVYETIAGLGATTKYLSIIYLGAKLTTVNFKGAEKQLSLYVQTVGKLIIFPVLIYIVGVRFFDPVMVKTFAIIMALPTMPSFPIFAKIKGGDEDYAIKLTFVGTLISLITIPLVVCIIAAL